MMSIGVCLGHGRCALPRPALDKVAVESAAYGGPFRGFGVPDITAPLTSPPAPICRHFWRDSGLFLGLCGIVPQTGCKGLSLYGAARKHASLTCFASRARTNAGFG